MQNDTLTFFVKLKDKKKHCKYEYSTVIWPAQYSAILDDLRPLIISGFGELYIWIQESINRLTPILLKDGDNTKETERQTKRVMILSSAVHAIVHLHSLAKVKNLK